ncbi:MAG TPA: flagellar filament capping protein FliD [Dehalococcoidia bacterium]
MPIQVSGLASGLDTDAIIAQLMAVQRRPLQLLQGKGKTEQDRLRALGDLSTRLSTLLSKVEALNLSSTLQAKRATTDTPSTQPAVLEATAGPEATVGSFQVTVVRLATATRAQSTAAVGAPVDAMVALQSAGFGTAPTSGTFTINGVSISVDVTTDTLNDVIARINGSGAGVTASLAGNRLTIAANDGITPVALGAGSDTSNFLSVTKLLASPAGTSRTSTGNLGVVQLTAPLDSARLATPLGSSTGTFRINGVEFTFDATQDSLSDVLSRINNSAAGVVAGYDSATDTVTLTHKATGSTSIDLEYVSGGDLLTSLNLLAAPQTLGQNAEFTVDGGAGPVTYYSSSNTVTDAVPGVTLKLLRESASPVTVTVSQDADAAVAAVKEFVDAYNAAVDYLRNVTRTDPTGQNRGPLSGDGGLRRIESSLRTILISPADGVTGTYTTLTQLGLSFGAVGSAVGTTNTLQLDEDRFREVLTEDPDAVARVFNALSQTEKGVMQKLAGVLEDYTKLDGVLDLREEATQDRIDDINEQVAKMEERLAAQEALLRRRFTLLETSLARLQGMQATLAGSLASILQLQD